MRHSLLLAFAFLLTLASACKKEDDDASIPFVPPYRVSGVVDFSIQKYSNGADPYEMYIAVEYENGEQERVTLSLENVPTGLKDSMYINSGFPTFNSVISFIDSGVAEGDYSVKLIATGEKSGRREFPFRIRILPIPNCSGVLAGQYTDCYSSCVGASTYTVNAQQSPSVVNRLIFSNLDNNGLQLYANVNCNTSSGNPYQMTFPSQTVNGITYSGYGYTFTSQGQPVIQMNIQRNNGSSCNYYLER